MVASWMWIVGGSAAVLGGAGYAAWRALRPRDTGQSGDLRLHRVADGVFLFRAYFSNAVVFELAERVVLVDALTSPFVAAMMKAAIAERLNKPVTHLIYTHFHGDHVGGSAVFEGAEVIATERTARYLVERDAERRAYVEAFGLIPGDFPGALPPTRTFSGELVLELDGERLEVRELGAVETDDACVVWWPARRALACGDGISTVGYPFLGAPVADEGLHNDGQWVAFFDRVRQLDPALILPGHGVPLVGADAISDRLLLLSRLMLDILRVVREELRHTDDVEEIVRRGLPRLARYEGRADLKQNVTTQRFAIYRAYNSLRPERVGLGWWEELRRPALVEPTRAELDAVSLDGEGQEAMLARAAAAAVGDARVLLLRWLELHPEDAVAWGVLAERMFGHIVEVGSIVDGSDYFRAARRAAERALTLDPDEPRGLLVLGSLEVWSAIILGQSPDGGVRRIERALATGRLDDRLAQRAAFFVGKAHQFALREVDSDRWLKRALPPWARPVFRLVRPLLRSIP